MSPLRLFPWYIRGTVLALLLTAAVILLAEEFRPFLALQLGLVLTITLSSIRESLYLWRLRAEYARTYPARSWLLGSISVAMGIITITGIYWAAITAGRIVLGDDFLQALPPISLLLATTALLIPSYFGRELRRRRDAQQETGLVDREERP